MVKGQYLEVKQGEMMDQNQYHCILYKPFQTKIGYPGLMCRSDTLHGEKT